MTDIERQNIDNDINMYKQLLTNTDYRALKYAEGSLSEEEFAETKANRAEWRAKINELQEQLAADGMLV